MCTIVARSIKVREATAKRFDLDRVTTVVRLPTAVARSVKGLSEASLDTTERGRRFVTASRYYAISIHVLRPVR